MYVCGPSLCLRLALRCFRFHVLLGSLILKVGVYGGQGKLKRRRKRCELRQSLRVLREAESEAGEG